MSGEELDELTDDDQDDNDDSDDEIRPTPRRRLNERQSARAASQIAGYLIVAGVVLAAGCVAFLVWEQWRANRAAAEWNSQHGSSPRLERFPVGANDTGSRPASDPDSSDSPGPSQSPAGTLESD